MSGINRSASDALRELQDNLHAALASLRRVEGLRDQLESSPELSAYADTGPWLRAWQKQHDTQESLESAINEVNAVMAWFAQQSESDATDFWIDQLIMFRDNLQSRLTNATQAATSFYEALRPYVVRYYLQNEEANPSWDEFWPYDASLAEATMVDLRGQLESRVDNVDIYVARLRWELDWSQQRMANVLGLSQPSIAVRLARIEDWISQRVAYWRVEQQANNEGFQIQERVVPSAGARGQTTRLSLLREEAVIELEIGAFTRDQPIRSTARTPGNPLIDSVLRAASRQERLPIHNEIEGIAVYDRTRGELEFYDMNDLARAVQSAPRASTTRLLGRILEIAQPTRTLAQLLERGKRYRQDSDQ